MTRLDVINDIVKNGHDSTLIVVWIKSELERKKLPKSEGCSLAVQEFGNGNPFSSTTIYRIKSIKEFKNHIYQENISHRVYSSDESKRMIVKKLSKQSKEFLLAVNEIAENPSEPMYQVLHSMARRF